MSNSYAGVVKGKLTFKGDSSKTVKSKKRSADSDDPKVSTVELKTNDDSGEIKILSGTGRITSSGTTVHGHYTEFMNQLTPGDAIIVNHPTT